MDAQLGIHFVHYQRTTASWELVSTSSGYESETDWKHYKWFSGKVLIRKAREADLIHNVQLGKMYVVKTSSKNKALRDFRSEP
jgi:hypothetical protein